MHDAGQKVLVCMMQDSTDAGEVGCRTGRKKDWGEEGCI